MENIKNLKILHLLSQRPDSTGSGIYLQAMIREAAACGHQNYLVAGLDSPLTEENRPIARDRSSFVNYHRGDLPFLIPGMSDVMPYPSSRWRDLTDAQLDQYEAVYARVLQDAVASFQPDIIHSHHLWIVTSLARRLFPDLPIVTSCHGSDLRQFQNCPHLRARVLSGCQGISAALALSEGQRQEIIRLYGFPPERVRVTGSGFNDRLFHTAPKPAPDPVQIVYAGKLSNAKGVPHLLRALEGLSPSAWQLHLLGSGSGPENDLCLDLARGLGDRVQVHGAVPQQELASIMRQCHILVLPSFYEGLPLVILEGLASGCRIVATDLPGTLEVLGGLDAEFISLVRTPRLHNMDEPYPEDEPRFMEELGEALQQQLTAAGRTGTIDLAMIKNTLHSYTWAGVFGKACQAYRDCLA
jgi:glycosyltransferase involved in cell wall biosynthesis